MTTLQILLLVVSAAAYKLRLAKPLGIQFEERAVGKAEGVTVAALVEGGNADQDGRILVGDRLIRVSAVSFGGQKALVQLGSGQQCVWRAIGRMDPHGFACFA